MRIVHSLFRRIISRRCPSRPGPHAAANDLSEVVIQFIVSLAITSSMVKPQIGLLLHDEVYLPFRSRAYINIGLVSST
jgi:hypothetical protein